MNNAEYDTIDTDTKHAVNGIITGLENLDAKNRELGRLQLDELLEQITGLIAHEPQNRVQYTLDALGYIEHAERARHISSFEARGLIAVYMPTIEKWVKDNAERCALIGIASDPFRPVPSRTVR